MAPVSVWSHWHLFSYLLRFLELLDKTSKSLRIQRHQVLDHNNSPVELCSSVETKGIMGNDSRPYVLDLLRTFPPDLNFQFSETEEDGDVPEECRRFGFPQRHCHSLASLRPELIEAFIQHRWAVGRENTALEVFQSIFSLLMACFLLQAWTLCQNGLPGVPPTWGTR